MVEEAFVVILAVTAETEEIDADKDVATVWSTLSIRSDSRIGG